MFNVRIFLSLEGLVLRMEKKDASTMYLFFNDHEPASHIK